MFMRNKIKQRELIFHTVTVIFITVTLCFSIFRFAPVFLRVLEALKDAGTSLAYYFLFVFLEMEYLVEPMIKILPTNIEAILPITLEEFELLMETYFEIITDLYYIELYIEKVGDVLYTVSQTIMMLMIPCTVLIFTLRLIYSIPDQEHNKDSKPLQVWKRVSRKTLQPTLFYFRKYWKFLRRKKWYFRILLCLWVYNLSGLTIALEIIAWIFYFSVSWDIEATLVAIVKILADFTIPLFFLSPNVWIIIAFFLFERWRVKKAKRRAWNGIGKVTEFLEDNPGTIFVNGKQRAKKTSLLTQFILLQEYQIFRPKANELLSNRDKQFPDFPWRLFDRFIVDARRYHKLYTWAGVRQFFETLKRYDEEYGHLSYSDRRNYHNYLKKTYGYKFKDFCFEYDRTKYPTTFDDGLKRHTIYDALESYAKLFMLYSQPTPLTYANYSIRSDFSIIDLGNFVEFEGDLVGKTTDESMALTQYCHILNWDRHRLGEQFNPDAADNDAVEYGVGGSHEEDKERKNQHTKRMVEKVAGEPNQDNDFVHIDFMMHGHAAECDNFSFHRWFFDAQKADELEARTRALTLMLYIKKAHAVKNYMPLFAFDEAIFIIASSIYDSIYEYIRLRKGSNTLLVYALRRFYTPLFQRFIRLSNRYNYNPLDLIPTDGGDQATGEMIRLPLLWLVAYRYRFASDANGDFYFHKTKKSPMGLNDTRQYESLRMTLEEMEAQNSYFIKDLTGTFLNKKKKDKK